MVFSIKLYTEVFQKESKPSKSTPNLFKLQFYAANFTSYVFQMRDQL